MPDYIITSVWLAVFIFCIYQFKKLHLPGIKLSRVIAAFIFSVLLGFANYYIWLNVVGHGDSLRYFKDSLLVYNTVFDNPVHYFQLLVGSDINNVPDHLKYITTQLTIEWHVKEYNMVRILAVINLFSFGSVWANIVILSFLVFLASAVLFKLLIGNFHLPIKIQKLLFAVMFFVPGFVFWRNGLLKEGPAYILLCILFVQILLLEKKFAFVRIGWMVIALLLLWMIRDYIAYLFVANLFIWILINYIARLNSRSFISFSLITLILTCISLAISICSHKWIGNKMKSEQEYFLAGEKDSDYDFQPLEGSLADLIQKIPYAINNVLFRPNFFHSTDPFRVYQSIETILILGFLLYSFLGLRRRTLSSTTILFFFLSVELLLVYGLMVTDADTLSRYRSIPFQFLVILGVCRWRGKNN